MVPVDCPCMNCKLRHMKCHSSCEDYALYKNEVARYHKNMSGDKDFQSYVAEKTEKAITKNIKRKQNRKG